MSKFHRFRRDGECMFAVLPHAAQEDQDNFVSQMADVPKEMGARGIDTEKGANQSGLTPADSWLLILLGEMIEAVVDTAPQPTAIQREEPNDA